MGADLAGGGALMCPDGVLAMGADSAEGGIFAGAVLTVNYVFNPAIAIFL